MAQPERRPRFNLRQQIERKQEEFEKMDVIEKATGPTPWISSGVTVPKEKTGGFKYIYEASQVEKGSGISFYEITIHGPNVEEHDKRLRKLLDTIPEKGKQ